MSCDKSARIPAWLVIALMICPPAVLEPQPASAQTMMMAPGQPTTAGQPMWVGQTPTYQVASDGAVHLDQPMMMQGAQYAPQFGMQQGSPQPYFAAQPFAAPSSPGQPMPVAQMPNQFTANQFVSPFSTGQPWGAQPQAVQPQTAWGQPLMPSPTVSFGGGSSLPSFIHRTSIFGEFLYVRPRDADVAYALPIDGPVAPVLVNEVPIGPTAVVDPGYDIAFRAGFNLAVDQGSSIAAQYTQISSNTEDSASVTAPTVLRSLVSHPLGFNAASDTLDAGASLDIQLDQIDIDFRSLWFGCECNYAYAVNYLVGATGATLDQDFDSSFVTIGTTNVNTSIDFEGVGMRFGLQGKRLWPALGAFVYGSGIGSALFGEFDATYSQVNSFNGTEAFTSYNNGRIVPVMEFEAGAGWYALNRHLRLSAGYRLTTWLNVVKTEDWIWAAQSHDYRNLDGSLTFDGLVGRAEWLF